MTTEHSFACQCRRCIDYASLSKEDPVVWTPQLAAERPREALEWASKQVITVDAFMQIDRMREVQNLFGVAIAALRAQVEALTKACEEISRQGYWSKTTSITTLREQLDRDVDAARAALALVKGSQP